jgi:hypothetical protein
MTPIEVLLIAIALVVLGSVGFMLFRLFAGMSGKAALGSGPTTEQEDAQPGVELPPRPIRILFLAANPKDTIPLRLGEEIRAIDQALQQARFRDRFELEQQWAVRVSDLQGHLLRYQPDIVHFSGHGSPANQIILEDDDGASQPVPASALSRLFAVLKDNIRCVVLNACYSAEQAHAIASSIDCVVGMSDAIGDEAAARFAAAFYQALAFGRSVRTAFDLGVGQIDLAGLAEQDIPQLVAVRGKAEDIVFVRDQALMR